MPFCDVSNCYKSVKREGFCDTCTPKVNAIDNFRVKVRGRGYVPMLQIVREKDVKLLEWLLKNHYYFTLEKKIEPLLSNVHLNRAYVLHHLEHLKTARTTKKNKDATTTATAETKK